MGAKKEQFDKRLLGRAPDCGRVSFKTGVILNEKDRARNRNSKLSRKNLRQQLRDVD